MMTPERAPCPFCGSLDAELAWRVDQHAMRVAAAVICLQCSAEGPVEESDADAWARWDDRAD